MRIDKTNLYRNITALLTILLVVTLIDFRPTTTKKNNNKQELENKSNEVIEYIFLGDSITNNYTLQKYYPEYPIINSGIGGDKTTDVLDELDNRVFKYNPKKVFLLIGINDLTHFKSPDYVAHNIELITKKIRIKFPKCKIYVESIYPVNYSWKNRYNETVPSMDTMINNIKITNNRIQEICEKHNYQYINTYASLVDDNNLLKEEYSKDGIHLSDEGYEAVTKVIKQNAFVDENKKETQI